MVKPSEPVLHEQPRNQRCAVIPLKHEESFLEWLRNTGRLIPRSHEEYHYEEEDEEEELIEVMDNDTYTFGQEEELDQE